MIRIPSEIIDICVNFIKDNDLGPIDVFEKPQRKYSETEEKRLGLLLDICEKIIKKELDIGSLGEEIKKTINVNNDNLIKDITNSLKIAFSSQEKKIKSQIKNPIEDLTKNIDKKTIFSAMINKKN